MDNDFTTPSPETLGARIQRTRLRRGLSVRDLAEKAGVNKNTVLRMEKGLTPSYATLTRVCEALGIHVAQLTQPEPEEQETIALHNAGQNVRLIAGDTLPTFASDEKLLLSVLGCRLPSGRLNAAVLELFGESDTVTHPGEELVYCLRGVAKLTVAGRRYRLREGDAATFWCSERHSYGPWSEQGEDTADDDTMLPVRVLSVWIDTREEAGATS